MKVLHVINSLTRGGAETLLVNSLSPGGLCEHADNYLVYFIKGDYLALQVDKKVKQICLNYKGGGDIVRMMFQLRRLIRDHNFDIIHTHLNPADFYVDMLRPKIIPQVHTMHTTYSTDFVTRRSFIFLERNLYFIKKTTNLIFLSDFTKSDFLNIVPFKGQSFVLNNFVSDPFFEHQPKDYKGSSERGLKLLAVGNFRPEKNYAYVIEIFKHLKQFNIQLDIYGGGDIEYWEKCVNENNLKITLKGQITNINEVIAGYDLFIMASNNEGFPLSVFEAMAAGVPLMLSDIAPLTSIVKDNAIYFGLDDAAKAAKQLIAVLHNETDINTLAVKAKLYAEQTATRDIYIQKLLSIYKQLLN